MPWALDICLLLYTEYKSAFHSFCPDKFQNASETTEHFWSILHPLTKILKSKNVEKKVCTARRRGEFCRKNVLFWAAENSPIKYKIAPPRIPPQQNPVLMRLVVLVAVIQRSGVELTYTLQLFPLFAGWGVPHRRVQASGGGGQISGKGVGLKSKKQ